MKKDTVFKFQNDDYKILVDDYKSGHIKVSMQNIKTKEIQDITIDAMDLIIPTAPTPNCALVNDNKELIDKLLDEGILDYCHSLMAEFSMRKLAFYDHNGVKKFMDKYAHEVTYRKDKGNTDDEIRKNIKKDAREVLKSKKVKEYLKENCLNMNIFLYSVLDKDNKKDSFVVFADENAEMEMLIQPYVNGVIDQVEFVPDYAYSNKEGLFRPLNENAEIIQINKDIHEWIIEELDNNYPDYEYKKGVQKYIKYCISKKIDKEDFMKKYEDVAEMMKSEKKKLKERGR